MWRAQVKVAVAEILKEWNETAQVLHHGHIYDLVELITDSIPSPDNDSRNEQDEPRYPCGHPVVPGFSFCSCKAHYKRK